MPTELPEQTEVTFRIQRWRLVVFAAFGAILTVQGAVLWIWLVAFSGQPVSLSMFVLIAASLFFALYGAWFTSYAWRRLREGDPAVVIDDPGITDRIIHPRPIPWRDMQKPLVRRSSRSGWQLVFDLSPEAEERIGIRPFRRQYAAWMRSIGYRSYRVLLLGTDGNGTKLSAAIARHVEFTRSTAMSRLLRGE